VNKNFSCAGVFFAWWRHHHMKRWVEKKKITCRLIGKHNQIIKSWNIYNDGFKGQQAFLVAAVTELVA